jgi:formylmethanofuran dehydrogenase subunit E
VALLFYLSHEGFNPAAVGGDFMAFLLLSSPAEKSCLCANGRYLIMSTKQATELEKIGRLHGHICFGLAVGYRAAMIAKREFNIGHPGEDHEIVAIMQESSCCEDAIQVITTCSWHRGNIIFQQCGQYVFIFYNQTTGRSLKLSLKQNLLHSSKEVHELKERLHQQVVATEEERKRFWAINQRFVEMILAADEEELFDIQRFEMTFLVKLDRFNSLYVPQANNCPCGSDNENS